MMFLRPRMLSVVVGLMLLVLPQIRGNLLPGDERLGHGHHPHHPHHHPQGHEHNQIEHGHHTHHGDDHEHHPSEQVGEGHHEHHHPEENHEGDPHHHHHKEPAPVPSLNLGLEVPAKSNVKKQLKGNNDRTPKQFKTLDDRKKGRNFDSKRLPLRIPRTSFSCKFRAPGYYSDMETNCTVYQMCTERGGRQAFFCPEGTKFNQRSLVCDHTRNVECSEASKYFYKNVVIHEASLKSTIRAKGRVNKSGSGKNLLQKRPRFQTSNVINIRRPQVIQSRVNGRLNFAPLFERNRNLDFSRFTTPKASSRKDEGPKEKLRSESILKEPKEPTTSLIKLLDLPELPIQRESSGDEKNSPVFVLKPKLIVNEPMDHDSLMEESETFQFLPPKEASQSVERFHKDPEQPALDLVPPPLSPSTTEAPVQFVGHVMTSDELQSFPNSPMVKIRVDSDARPRTLSFPRTQIEQNLSPERHTSSRSQTSGQARSNGGFEEPGVVGLPVQLKFPGKGLPDSLMWVDPGSLARSPMVQLRTLSNALPVEHALTMNFPARKKQFLHPKCMRCLSTQQIVSKCREVCVTIK
ncbi:uncharacterized protein LOC131880427 [Tigriopus californicus]|uniref:uncharacterized protein LOC131880427 n=1 Tax=Tigriopus californicus TaxID=6832 RepID=UPI0027DA3465|nr:uncharacterized protein LOC131880427 [Tigriopus californicus]